MKLTTHVVFLAFALVATATVVDTEYGPVLGYEGDGTDPLSLIFRR